MVGEKLVRAPQQQPPEARLVEVRVKVDYRRGENRLPHRRFYLPAAERGPLPLGSPHYSLPERKRPPTGGLASSLKYRPSALPA